MAIVRIPTPLRAGFGGNAQVEVAGADVREAFASLESRYPGGLSKVLDGAGRVNRFVNVFVNSGDIRDAGGLDTKVAPGDTISIIPAIAGGRRRA